MKDLVTPLSSIVDLLKKDFTEFISTVNNLSATLLASIGSRIEEIVEKNQELISKINEILKPFITQLEAGVKNVDNAVLDMTKSLNASLSKSNCTLNIAGYIQNLPVLAEGIVLECLEPAKRITNSVEIIIKNILTLNNNSIGKIRDCGTNLICLGKELAEATRLINEIGLNVITISFKITMVIPEAETCLSIAVAKTLLNEQQKIAKLISDCLKA